MNKQDQKFLIAIAFLLMTASAIALGIVMRQNQHKYHPAPTSVSDTAPAEHHPTIEEIEDAILDDMATAFAIVESGNRCDKHNSPEDAIGCLQIRRIMVDQANQDLGQQFFSYDDRWDRELSYYIFEVVMRHHNPELDIDAACDIWNPNCPNSYRQKIKNTYCQVMAQSLKTRGY